MTDNQKAALSWVQGNESRANRLAALLRESCQTPEDKARISETITCLLKEAERFRAYAAQS